jgi:autotransporter family porin
MPTINAIGTPQITLGGTFTMSGLYTFQGNLTGNTNVTFPTSGTLATTSGTVPGIIGTDHQVLANGTFGSPVSGTNVTLTTPQDIDVTSDVNFGTVTAVTTITASTGAIQALASSVIAGSDGNVGSLVSYSPTTVLGTLSITSADNAGNYGNLLTNASTTAARTWNLPDADGTIALVNSSAQTFDGDSGSATPSSGTITFTGASTGLTFAGAGSTMTLGGVLLGVNGGTGHANTGLTINLGSGSAGYVLTSDSSGNATWQAPGYLTGAVLLSPSGDQTITAHNLSLSAGNFTASGTINTFNSMRIGSSATPSGDATLYIFSPTANLGALIINSANNAGNYGISITNASFGQASTLTLQDPGASSANFALAPSALVNGNLIEASGTLGLIADSGIAASSVATTSTAVLLAPSGNQTITGNYTLQGYNLTATNALNAGNLELTGNTLESTNSNGNINISPNGTGILNLISGAAFTNASGLRIQGYSTGSPGLSLGFASYDNNATKQVDFRFYKSRSATVGTFTAVQTGDTLGSFTAYGDGGSSFLLSSTIQFLADGTVSSTQVPGKITFSTVNSSTGNTTQALAIDSSQVATFANAIVSNNGINFGGSTLENYVTAGTFTPVFTFTTPGDLSVSYSVQAGNYTRVGNVVNAQIQIVATPTFTTASGEVSITGLPIATTSASGYELSATFISYGFSYPAAATVLFLYAGGSATTMSMYGVTATGTNPQVGTTQFVSGQAIQIHANFTYLV